jgi:hypothetical protein
MRHAIFIFLAFALVALVSCTTHPLSTISSPTLEVSQVQPYHWDVIVRLHDESAKANSVRCSIYRVIEDGTNEIDGKLADIRLARTEESGEFIGIYSNGKEIPHGTKVVAIYKGGRGIQPVRASTTMYYH